MKMRSHFHRHMTSYFRLVVIISREPGYLISITCCRLWTFGTDVHPRLYLVVKDLLVALAHQSLSQQGNGIENFLFNFLRYCLNDTYVLFTQVRYN
jgi:hypothetical protein